MKKALIILVILFISTHLTGENQQIEMFTYHTHAPFILENDKGLSYDLADYLTRKSNGQYRSIVIPMTRARVNKLLEEKITGIVPWVSPDWFNDREETIYLWTDGYIMEDGNTVISRASDHLDYRGPETVLGLIFGGVRGHHYVDIDELAESGEITRLDNENHLNNFRMLLKGRIDFTIAPYTGSQYIIRKEEMSEELYLSRYMHSTYKRRIIISHGDEELQEFLDTVLSMIREDERWKWLLAQYR